MRRLLWLWLCVLACGCATGRTIVVPTPTAAQIDDVRHLTDKALVATDMVLSMADLTGRTLDLLPLPAATKTQYDCALVKTFGMTAPAPQAVVTACGAVPLSAVSPFQRGLDAVKVVTTCPGLGSAATALLGVLDPLIRDLETSTDRTLALAGASIRVALAFIAQLAGGGVMCSA